MSFSTIPEMFLKVCEKFAGDSDAARKPSQKPAFMFKRQGVYESMTYSELRDKVECFAIGLLDLGVREGDRIGIVSENRVKWIIADFAITAIGAVDVPLFPILTAAQEEYIFKDCNVSAIVVSNNFQLGKVLQFKDKLPSLRHIIVMNNEFDAQDVAVKSMENIIKRGEELKTPDQRRTIFEDACGKVKPDDLLTLIYTSGTTGNPKGVMLTHSNLVSNIYGAMDAFPLYETDVTLSFLPLCHSYERMAGFYTMFAAGATIALSESVESVPANLLLIKPTIMTTVPRLLEKVKKRVYANIANESPAKQKIFNWAVNTGIKYLRKTQEGKSTLLLKPQYNLASKLVFEKIRERMGGNMRLLVSGGAALAPDVHEFFLAIGILVIQGYGLTETSPVVSCTRVSDMEVGTIGKPLYNVEVKLAEDGEILARGPNVMRGYWNDEEATKNAIDPDGWLYTGDVGIMTSKGNIQITDRKKYIFVSSGGKNIAPQPIENLLAQSKFIEHCILIGDSREFCTALITPDFEQLKSLAGELGVLYQTETELIFNDKIVKHIKKDIDYYQKDLSKFERVRRFKLLSQPFSVENGELSPKMSIKRHIVEKKYAAFIEAMYGEGND